MIIAGFQKNSTIDFPGRFSSVVFVANCNYNCYYCHNRHLLGAQEKVFKEDIFEFLVKRRGQIDGVVITGGEPSLYDDLPDFILEVKSLGYAVKLDTNGSRPQMIQSLIENDLLDFIAVDYKAPFPNYDLIDACENIEENRFSVTKTINEIMDSGIDYEVRTTMIPEITESDIIDMARSFPEFKKFALQKYRPVPDTGSRGTGYIYKEEDLKKMAEKIKVFQPNLIIRA